MNEHAITIEVVALTDNPALLHELLRSIISEGLAQYSEYGDLEPFKRLTVHITTPHGEMYKLVSYEAHPPPDEEMVQSSLFERD